MDQALMEKSAASSRIREIPPDRLTDAHKAALDAVVGGRGRIPTPYKIWLHSPVLMQRLERLGTFLVKESSLTPREQEIAILTVAKHWHGTYVFTAHSRAARKAGINDEIVAAIGAGETPPLVEARERAVYAIARSAESPTSASDSVFDSAIEALGHNGLSELLVFLGYYSSVAIAMKLFKVPVPLGDA
jgi:4-carboxymuconolactone decarboxylase